MLAQFFYEGVFFLSYTVILSGGATSHREAATQSKDPWSPVAIQPRRGIPTMTNEISHTD